MSTETAHAIGIGDTVPTSSVKAADGSVILLRSSPHRAVVLMYPHTGECPQCTAYLQQLNDHAAAFSRWTALPIVVVDDHRHGDHLSSTISFPVVVDDALRHRFAISGDHAAVLVVDRHGQIWEQFSSGDHAELPDPDRLTEDVKFIAIQCPECDVLDIPGLGDWSE